MDFYISFAFATATAQLKNYHIFVACKKKGREHKEKEKEHIIKEYTFIYVLYILIEILINVFEEVKIQKSKLRCVVDTCICSMYLFLKCTRYRKTMFYS